MVNMLLAVNGDNLEDLPVGGHGHAAVGLKNIRLPNDKFLGGVIKAQHSQIVAQGRETVENSALDGFRMDHAIERIFPGTKVVDEVQLV